MVPQMIFDQFRTLFPLFSVTAFSSIGKHSIKIKTEYPDMEFIFTYKSPIEWRFETVKTYTNELKEKKHGNK